MSTLLNGVNAVLKKVHIIQGDAGALTTLTDSARQGFIDVAVQSWNEMIDELYSEANMERPRAWKTNTISLVDGTRTYSLQSDVNVLHWPLHDQTNGNYIFEFPGGYLRLVESQNIPANFTGRPQFAALSTLTTETNTLYMDRVPGASEDGDSYTYHYEADTELTAAADTMPFNEAVYRALIPAVAEVWQRHQHRDFDNALFRASLGRAARLLTQRKQRSNYWPQRFLVNDSDPFHAR